MQAAKIAKQGSSHHDVVEMRHYKISVGDMDVKTERGEERARQTTNRKQTDKAEGVEHRRVVRDGAFI